MREIRLSGSEGGVALIPPSLPLSPVVVSRSSLCWKVGFHKSYSPGLVAVLVTKASTHEPWFWI